MPNSKERVQGISQGISYKDAGVAFEELGKALKRVFETVIIPNMDKRQRRRYNRLTRKTARDKQE